MVIENSSIGMESARTYTSVSMRGYSNSGTLFAFPELLDAADQAKTKQEVSDPKKLSDDTSSETDAETAKNDFDGIFNRMKAFATSDALEKKMQKDAMDRIRVECIQFLLYMLFGTRGCRDDVELPQSEGHGGNAIVSEVTETYRYFHSESEETCFSTTGCVRTADGRELNFDLNLTMSRSFTQYYERNISSVRTFTDPLVINLDAPMAEVSDVNIRFDLDCDGEAEEISALNSSSGYLALDLNGDKTINDGSELFGTKSGDGFSDLSKYDSDGNGWIDEADEIFDKLVIAFIKEDGTQELVKLKDRDVGAIYTGSASTDFSLNDLATNETRARIRQTGIFLYESGMMGTIQHLDLAR